MSISPVLAVIFPKRLTAMLSTSECMWWHLWLLVATIIFLQGSCSVPHSFQHFGPFKPFFESWHLLAMIALNVTLGQDVTKQRSSDWVGLAAKTENRHIWKHFSGLWIIAPIWEQFELMTTERELLPLRRIFKRLWFKVFFGGEENYAKLPIEAIFTGNLFSYYLALGLLWDYNWITMSQQSLTWIELLMFLRNSTFKTNKMDCKWHSECQSKHCHRHNGPWIEW